MGNNNRPKNKIEPMDLNQVIAQGRYLIRQSITEELQQIGKLFAQETDLIRKAEIVRMGGAIKTACHADIEVATVRMLRSAGVEFYQGEIEDGKPIAHVVEPPPAEPTPEELEAEAQAADDLAALRARQAKGSN